MSGLRQQLHVVAARNHRLAQPGPLPCFHLESAVKWAWRRVSSGQVSSGRLDRTQNLNRLSRLEAALFLSREPLTLRKLAQLANLTDATEARTLLAGLRNRYDERGSAFQVVQVSGGYQLLSRPEFSPWLRPQAAFEPPVRLSPPALETLAVVAYRQPVLRSEVEAIRGVSCGEVLRQLLDRDLLRIVGRSEELGRPLWYGTTKRFLQMFGLRNLDELPWAAQLRRADGQAQVDSPGNSADTGAGLTGGVDAA
jgi:segregation and condensation protein B